MTALAELLPVAVCMSGCTAGADLESAFCTGEQWVGYLPVLLENSKNEMYGVVL